MAGLKQLLLKLFPLHYYTSYRSYSQDGEDMILKSFYESRKGYKGFFVDVGAHHPIRYSNTWYFYKKGWRGINIEPTPTAITAFQLLRRRDINLNIGVAPQKGTLRFYAFNEPALNTFSAEAAKKASASGRYNVIRELDIPVVPLGEVLDTHLPAGQVIDVLTIDVEGFDLDVLKSNDWEKYQPLHILVEEHVDLETIGASPIYRFLKEKGYSLVGKTFRNLVFKLPS